MKVGELKALLATLPDDAPLVGETGTRELQVELQLGHWVAVDNLWYDPAVCRPPTTAPPIPAVLLEVRRVPLPGAVEREAQQRAEYKRVRGGI